MNERVIFHIDMDAFFASVEQRDNPVLRDKPVAVIGANARTVVVTSSYRAREFGVKTGMTIFQAKKLCPELIFVTASNNKYTKICEEIFEILYTFTPDVEMYSIDEFFMDMAGSLHLFGSPEQTAQKIKAKIKDATKLTATIGIGPNKLLAKLASDLDKPDGIFWIKEENARDVLKDLAVDKLWGIGPATREKLKSLHINNIGELAGFDARRLKRIFGVFGERLHEMSRGIDQSPVIPPEKTKIAKSISHSRTLEKDTTDLQLIKKHILELSSLVGQRMREAGFEAHCIALNIRLADFTTFTRQQVLKTPTQDTAVIFRIACSILEKARLKRPVRLLGVGVAKLSPANNLFLLEEDKRRFRLNQMLDKINKKPSSAKVTFASLLDAKSYNRAISPSWRPQGTRKY